MTHIVWWIGNSPVAEADVDLPWLEPESFGFGCPHCGEIWARMQVAGATRWVFPNAPCEACPPYFDRFPGGLLIDAIPLAQCPPTLLQREVHFWARNGATT